jgi:hypothetical protein
MYEEFLQNCCSTIGTFHAKNDHTPTTATNIATQSSASIRLSVGLQAKWFQGRIPQTMSDCLLYYTNQQQQQQQNKKKRPNDTS